MHQKQDKPNRSSDMHQWISHAEGGCIQKSKRNVSPVVQGSWWNTTGLKKGTNQKTKMHHVHVKTEGREGGKWRDCPTSQLFKIHSKEIWWHRQ